MNGCNHYLFLQNGPPNAQDAWGLITVKECEENIKDIVQGEASDIINYPKNNNCVFPYIFCRCCWFDDAAGRFSINRNTIKICANNVESIEGLKVLIRHELIHSAQNCKRKRGDSCGECMCSEIGAYYDEVQRTGNFPPSMHEQVVSELAALSCMLMKACPDQAAALAEASKRYAYCTNPLGIY
jgi:hypothetical protein